MTTAIEKDINFIKNYIYLLSEEERYLLNEEDIEKKTKIIQFLGDKSFLLHLNQSDSTLFKDLFRFFPIELRKDDEIVKLAFETPILQNNNKVDYQLERENQINFNALSTKHKKDFKFIMWLMKTDPLNYKIIPSSFRKNKEIMLLAFATNIVSKYNEYYAPKNLSDKELIKSIFHDERMIFHINKELFKDVPFIEELYEQQSFSFGSFPVKSTEFITRKMVLTALDRKDVSSFHWLPVEYRNDLSIMIPAIKLDPFVLRALGSKVLKEQQEEIILNIVNNLDKYGFNQFQFSGIIKVKSLLLKIIIETFKPDCKYKEQQELLFNNLFFHGKNTLKDIVQSFSFLKDNVNSLTGIEGDNFIKSIVQNCPYISDEIKKTFNQSSFETISFSLKLEDKNKLLMKQVKNNQPVENLFKRKLLDV
jgi:hypothetical protein